MSFISLTNHQRLIYSKRSIVLKDILIHEQSNFIYYYRISANKSINSNMLIYNNTQSLLTYDENNAGYFGANVV